MTEKYILTLSCPDRVGLVHEVSGLLLAHRCNIEEAQQFNDPATGRFFMRVQFACDAAQEKIADETLNEAIDHLAQRLSCDHIECRPVNRPLRAVIFVSRQGHCLNDLLFRHRSGLLNLDIRAVIGNHRDFYQLVAGYNIPFHYLPITGETRAEVEEKQLEIIRGEQAELIILARYMQILSENLCTQLAGRAINIHHSFLPSFKGARPYYQAHERGVKLIGATAHFVTAQLDEGPIIEQDVARVDHACTPEDLTAVGRDTESQVLARAVKWVSERRVLLNGHKTVVFQ